MEQMTSFVNSAYDVAGCFRAAEEVLGSNRDWNAVSPIQTEFLADFLPVILPVVEDLRRQGLLDSRVSWLADEINRWFAERGFSIELTQQGPDTFYVGSIYEQLVKWLIPGTSETLRGQDGKSYPAVFMDDDNGFSVKWSTAHNRPVIRLRTKDERDHAYLMVADTWNQPFALLRSAVSASKSLTWSETNYDRVRFPMVDLNLETDLSWLLKMWTRTDRGQRAVITEAKQQSILKINEKGALAKSASGMAITLEAFSPPGEELVIDQPFLFWIERDGMPWPMFTALVDYPDWKNPGNLK